MKGIGILLLFCTLNVTAQDIRPVKFDHIEKLIASKGESIKVVNFWATWCKPCVEELPEFEKLTASNDNVEVFLVALDYVENLAKVQKFVSKKNLKSTVLLLDETNYDSFIPKVSSSWSGAIPATLIINASNGETRFFEKKFQEGELSGIINNFIN